MFFVLLRGLGSPAWFDLGTLSSLPTSLQLFLDVSELRCKQKARVVILLAVGDPSVKGEGGGGPVVGSTSLKWGEVTSGIR